MTGDNMLEEDDLAQYSIQRLINAVKNRQPITPPMDEVIKLGHNVVPGLINALADRCAANTSAAEDLDGIIVEVEKTVPVLIKALNDVCAPNRQAVPKATGNNRPEGKYAIQAAIAVLDGVDGPERKKATEALGVICIHAENAAKDVVPELIKALKDHDQYVRTAAAEALGGIGKEAKSAIPELITTLSDTEVKDFAMEALINIGDAAIPALTKALDDDNYDIATYARSALEEIEKKGRE